MKLGLTVDYSGREFSLPIDAVLEAERLGYDSCWTAEAWGSDAATPLAWIGALTSRIKLGSAIMQTAARTPAACAMTAMTIDALSGGRFILGVGPSGPQVVEGWHGVSHERPVTRVKEYVRIVRDILRREGPLRFDGYHYQLPYQGPGATGLGKPLKSILHGRPDMKIYTAAISPAGVRAAAEVADGFFPILTDPDRFADTFEPYIEAGIAARDDGFQRKDFEVLPTVAVVVGDDVEACRNQLKPDLALYIGGMGARDKNYYKELAARSGFEGAAQRIQDLYLDGRKDEAAAAVPDELIDGVALCGPRSRIAERLERYHSSGITSLCVSSKDIDVVRMMAELLL